MSQLTNQSWADFFEDESGTIMLWAHAITEEELEQLVQPWEGFEYKPLAFWPLWDKRKKEAAGDRLAE